MCTSEIGAYLKSIDDDSKIICDEIIDVIIAIPINSDNKKLRYKMSCCVLHTVLLVIILLFIIINICFYYIKHMSTQKNILTNC